MVTDPPPGREPVLPLSSRTAAKARAGIVRPASGSAWRELRPDALRRAVTRGLISRPCFFSLASPLQSSVIPGTEIRLISHMNKAGKVGRQASEQASERTGRRTDMGSVHLTKIEISRRTGWSERAMV